MDIIYHELNKMGILCDNLTILQDKDGTTVARIVSSGQPYVIKCFQNEAFKREIRNYRLLSYLEIPTMKVIAATDSAILLEDITCSPVYRLGIEGDLDNPEVAKKIAAWYRQLHHQGYKYVAQHGAGLYDEADFFTLENIAGIKEKTGMQSAPAWEVLEREFGVIRQMLHTTRKTLTYNDFYYTNLIVAKDCSSAIMFDYNLLGKGYAYSDLRNVTSSLTPRAKEAFLAAYGAFDTIEAVLDDVVCVVVTLHLACQREQFPGWGKRLLEEVDTTLMDKLRRLTEAEGLSDAKL